MHSISLNKRLGQILLLWHIYDRLDLLEVGRRWNMKRTESTLVHWAVVPTPTVWEKNISKYIEIIKWKRMLTFKHPSGASPIPTASILSAQSVVVVTRPHRSTTCLVWENFSTCYKYWIWKQTNHWWTRHNNDASFVYTPSRGGMGKDQSCVTHSST